jgi:hypothetical protein
VAVVQVEVRAGGRNGGHAQESASFTVPGAVGLLLSFKFSSPIFSVAEANPVLEVRVGGTAVAQRFNMHECPPADVVVPGSRAVVVLSARRRVTLDVQVQAVTPAQVCPVNP